MTQVTQTLALKIIEVAKAPTKKNVKALAKEIKVQPIIVRYYLIKGLKEAKFSLILNICNFERANNINNFRQVILKILNALYTKEDNYSAYDGIGSLQDFVDFYKAHTTLENEELL